MLAAGKFILSRLRSVYDRKDRIVIDVKSLVPLVSWYVAAT